MIQLYQGRIKEIDDLKESRNGGAYKRVYFQMKIPISKWKSGDKKYFWAKTDLVLTYRNYPRWEKFLEVGNVLSKLQLKTENTVDADSYPVLLGKLEREPEISPLQKSLWKQK